MGASLSIVALVAARNEGDVIKHVVGDLIAQGVSVYLLDDESTDDTVSQVEAFRGHGLIGVEQLSQTLGRAHQRFEWARILERKSQLAREIEADWFIHHDADEFREAPWPDVSLSEGIRRVDALGFNAIDFALFEFVPTDDSFRPGADVRQCLTRYRPGAAHSRVQIRCWKRTAERVDLASSGGHDASFAGRRVFPLRFLLRHYPIRSQAHGRRKVLEERQPEFLESERRRGWHVQYDDVGPQTEFVRSPEVLLPFDADRARLELLLAPPEMEARVDQLKDEIASRDSALAALERALTAVEESLNEARARVETLKRAHADRQQDAEMLRNALEARLSEVAELRRNALTEARRVEALYASRSWRLTRPLRVLYEVATGVGGAEPVPATPREPSARLHWGDLARLSPISSVWGTDRGLPIDRYYIHRFLARWASDIRGRVLEVKDPHYARRYGGSRVTAVDVVDIDATNPVATVVSDLTDARELESNCFDCVILTQTLHTIYDIHAAVREARRILKPGGVLLSTLPAMSRVNFEDGGLVNGDFWRVTRAAVLRLFGDTFGDDAVTVETGGNVRVSTAFLYGLAVEDLDDTDFALDDPWFPLIHCVRAEKRGDVR